MIVKYFAGKNWKLAGLNKWKDISLEETPDPEKRVAVFPLDGFEYHIFPHESGFIAVEPPPDKSLPKWIVNAAGGNINRIICCEEEHVMERAREIMDSFAVDAVVYRVSDDGSTAHFISLSKNVK